MLTLDNLANKNQYTNTHSTFEELFAYDIVPVVNENDTVAVEELHFGDNDTLSAKVPIQETIALNQCMSTPMPKQGMAFKPQPASHGTASMFLD